MQDFKLFTKQARPWHSSVNFLQYHTIAYRTLQQKTAKFLPKNLTMLIAQLEEESSLVFSETISGEFPLFQLNACFSVTFVSIVLWHVTQV